MNRRSLQGEVVLAGVGLFTEAACNLRLTAAPAGHGIVFVRGDVQDARPIAANVHAVSTDPIHRAFASLPPRHTILREHTSSVATVEHVLSALAGLGITDALIEMDGPEVPIFDGSAQPFVAALIEAGIRSLDATIEPIVVHESITVQSGERWIKAEPCDERGSYTYELDYGTDEGQVTPIRPQRATWDREPETYIDQIAPARTFSLEDEAKAMQALGLFTTFSPRDLLVVGSAGPIDNAWRFDNEPARHKLLDLIGDLSLAGAPVRAHITAHRSGHALNHEMARALASLHTSPRQ
jgi:UDP-3-O-acyl N-acetylglucosamine deacetylase